MKGTGDYNTLVAFSLTHGFALTQINLDNPRYFPERHNREERAMIRRAYREKNIGLCFHGPSDIPLMNRHEKIRLAGLERVYEMIDMAVDMGGEYFIFHPGRLAFYSMSTQKVFFMEQRYPERIMEIFADSLKRLISYCSGRILLCIENTHAISGPYLSAISRLVSENGLALVWDVGHTEQLAEPKRQQLIRFFQDNIKHVKLAHLHDVVGDADHKALGSGRLDVAAYLEIFDTLGIDIILEIFPENDLLRSVEYLRKLEPSGRKL